MRCTCVSIPVAWLIHLKLSPDRSGFRWVQNPLLSSVDRGKSSRAFPANYSPSPPPRLPHTISPALPLARRHSYDSKAFGLAVSLRSLSWNLMLRWSNWLTKCRSSPPSQTSNVSHPSSPILHTDSDTLPVPRDITIWDWLFDSPSSTLNKVPASELRGYSNGITGERINYAQVRDATTLLSTALVKKYGLRVGEAVALFSPNSIWYPVAMLGTLRVGGVVSGASPAYNIEEMTYALQKAGAKFIFTVPGSMDVAAAAAKNAGIPKDRVFLLEGELDGFTTMNQLLDTGKSYGKSGQVSSFKIPRGKKNKDVCAFLSFSSGTTGLPKAVMIAHQNMIAQCLQVQLITPPDLQKILAVLPTFHSKLHGNLEGLLEAYDM